MKQCVVSDKYECMEILGKVLLDHNILPAVARAIVDDFIQRVLECECESDCEGY